MYIHVHVLSTQVRCHISNEQANAMKIERSVIVGHYNKSGIHNDVVH